MGTKTLSVKLTLNDKNFQTGLRKASRSLKKIGNNFKNVGSSMSRNFTLPLIGAGAAAIKLASDYEESLNKVKVAFGSTSIQVETFAKTTLESFGIAEGSALEMASLFGDMSTSMGLTEQEAAAMSTQLVGLAGDLASFKNIGIEKAQEALAGIFTGETESLKKLGIVMTEANLKSSALTQGMNSNVKSMTQAEKVALRYAFVMANTANAQGDFARTSDGFANQARILQESLKQLGQELGKIILPLATKVVNKFNSIVKSLSDLSTEQKENIIFWSKIAAIVGPLIFVFGKIIVFLGQLANGFRILKAVIITNPFTLLVTAALAFVSAVSFAILDLEGFIKTALSFGKIGRLVSKVILNGLGAINPKYRAAAQAIDLMSGSLDEQEDNLKDSTKQIESQEKALKDLLKATTTLNTANDGGSKRTTLDKIVPKKSVTIPINLELPEDIDTIEDKIKGVAESFSEAFFDFSEEFKDSLQRTIEGISNLGNQVSGVFSSIYEKQNIEAENAAAKEKERLENSAAFAQMTEEEKAEAIAVIDENLAIKKKDIAKKQARADKAAAMFQAAISTASAVVQALPNLPLAIAIGAIGLAQIGVIASTPIPAFADGGLVSGATMGLVGEGPGTSMSNPEVIAPLDKLKGMIGGAGGGVEVFGRISGSDILISSDRARDNRKRTRGY